MGSIPSAPAIMIRIVHRSDLLWLAGLMEGEGSFLKASPSAPNSPRMSVNMTDRDVIERVAALFCASVTLHRRQKPHHKDSYFTFLKGTRAVILMRKLKPLMGIRRQRQIDGALATYKSPTPSKIGAVKHRVKALAGRGWSTREISRSVGVNHVSVWKFLKSNAG